MTSRGQRELDLANLMRVMEETATFLDVLADMAEDYAA